MQKQDGDDYLKGEDEIFLQETRVSDEAALHEEVLWKNCLQTHGSRLMVTQANLPTKSSWGQLNTYFTYHKKAKVRL